MFKKLFDFFFKKKEVETDTFEKNLDNQIEDYLPPKEIDLTQIFEKLEVEPEKVRKTTKPKMNAEKSTKKPRRKKQ